VGVLALCFVMGPLGCGLPDRFGVYVVPLANDFGWGRAEVVSIYSFYAVASALAGPLIGRLFDRSGPRTVYLTGITLLGVSFGLAGFAQSLWQLQTTIGLGVGNRRYLSRQYHQHRASESLDGARLVFATSIVFSGYGLGIFTLVPLSRSR
jgi:MFS family permease